MTQCNQQPDWLTIPTSDLQPEKFGSSIPHSRYISPSGITFARCSPREPPNMRPNARLPLRLLSRTVASQCRTMHITACKAATVAPTLGAGPPPEPPTPTVRNMTERIERRRRQADMMKQVKVIRNAQDGKTTTLRKRFWKEVTVSEVDGTAMAASTMNPHQ